MIISASLSLWIVGEKCATCSGWTIIFQGNSSTSPFLCVFFLLLHFFPLILHHIHVIPTLLHVIPLRLVFILFFELEGFFAENYSMSDWLYSKNVKPITLSFHDEKHFFLGVFCFLHSRMIDVGLLIHNIKCWLFVGVKNV
jgi:hypothetical protein